KRNIISLHGRKGKHLFALAALGMHGYRISKYFLNALFANTVPKMHKVAGITAKLVLKMGFSAKVLHIWVLNPSFGQGFIAIVIKVFEQMAPNHKANGHGRLASQRIKPGKLILKIRPVDGVSQKNQFLIRIKKIG